MATKILNYKYELMLAIIAGLLLFSGLSKVEVNIMEARNFQTAREMVQNNEYLLTTLNAEPRYQKPPLPTWLTAISGSLFGFDSLYAMRMPVAFITLLLVFAFYFLSKRMGFNPKSSFNNALILITSFYIFFAGRDNQWDIYTHSFMIVSIYFLWRLLQEDSHPVRNSLMSGLFLGFSFLSKGPISFYALLLPFIISYLIVYRIPVKRKGLSLLVVLVSGLVIGASWYVYVRMNDPEYFRAIATHETSNWTNYEIKPFYYYWNFFIQSGLWTIPSLIALMYPYLKRRVANLKAYRFTLLWTVFSVVLLSLVPEKKVRYLVPTLIPLALTTGFYIDYLFKAFGSMKSKKESLLVYINYGILAFVGVAYPFVILFLLKEGVKSYIFTFIVTSALVLLSSYLIIRGLIGRKFGKTFYSSIALFCFIIIGTLPMSVKFFANPDYSPASSVLGLEKQYDVNTYRLSEVAPEIIWNFGKVVPLINPNKINVENGKQFGLMVGMDDSTRLKPLLSTCNLQKLYRINLNYRKKNKSRLIKDYYLVTAKTSTSK
ncbi:MAG TPA: glycosyltransferase family 39 protein [Tenuifilaceae bacterium]|nr:glycosyltransferase family 39 protein [Tenuifilaceae bacterium]